MGKQDADINSCNKLQIDIEKIVYNSSSEVIAHLSHNWIDKIQLEFAALKNIIFSFLDN